MPSPRRNNQDLLRYAGLGTQIFVSLAIAVYLGRLADTHLLTFSFPLFTVLLPFIVLVIMIYILVRQTNNKGKNDIEK